MRKNPKRKNPKKKNDFSEDEKEEIISPTESVSETKEEPKEPQEEEFEEDSNVEVSEEETPFETEKVTLIEETEEDKPLGECYSDDDILFTVSHNDNDESTDIVLEENILKEKKETNVTITPEEISELDVAVELTADEIEESEKIAIQSGEEIEITEEPQEDSHEVLVLDSNIEVPQKPDYLEKIDGVKITGVTGKSGAGKSVITKKLAHKKNNCAIVDADKLYHNLLSRENLAVGIVFALGKDVLTDKKIDRKKLANKVFADKSELEKLNKATHPFIAREIRRLIEGAKEKGIKEVVLDAPTLFESGLDAICDEIIFVKADKEVRLERIEKRDKISRDDALNRLKYEKDDEFYTERCSAIITNN